MENKLSRRSHRILLSGLGRERGLRIRSASQLLIALVAWLLSLVHGIAQPSTNEVVTSFKQFYQLSTDQAQTGSPVRIKAVVLCFDAGWNQLYVHDGADTQYFAPASFHVRPETGQMVEITGATSMLEGARAFTNLDLRILGPGTLPPGKQLGFLNLASDFGQWIQTTGSVRVVDTSMGRLTLVLHEQNQRGKVYVMEPLGTNDYRGLLDSRIRIRGINASKSVNGILESIELFVPRFREIRVLEKPSSSRASVAVSAVSSLLARQTGSWTNQLVRINGLISAYQPGQSLVVRDPTGNLRAQIVQATALQVDARVDVYGYLKVTPKEVYLSDAYFEVTSSPPPSIGIQAGEGVSTPLMDHAQALTNISAVLKLSRAEAEKKIPVRLRGVVTFADPDWRNAFLQGPDGAVYFELAQKDVRPGQWIELRVEPARVVLPPRCVTPRFRC
jgi:hypothetical protein